MESLKIQIGGDHYKGKGIQPVEYIHKNGLGYLEGCVIKYLTRHKEKGGREDLVKAKHYIDFLLDFEYPPTVAGTCVPSPSADLGKLLPVDKDQRPNEWLYRDAVLTPKDEIRQGDLVVVLRSTPVGVERSLMYVVHTSNKKGTLEVTPAVGDALSYIEVPRECCVLWAKQPDRTELDVHLLALALLGKEIFSDEYLELTCGSIAPKLAPKMVEMTAPFALGGSYDNLAALMAKLASTSEDMRNKERWYTQHGDVYQIVRSFALELFARALESNMKRVEVKGRSMLFGITMREAVVIDIDLRGVMLSRYEISSDEAHLPLDRLKLLNGSLNHKEGTYFSPTTTTPPGHLKLAVKMLEDVAAYLYREFNGEEKQQG